MHHPCSPRLSIPLSHHAPPGPYALVEALLERVPSPLRELLQGCAQPTAWPIHLPILTCQAVGGDLRQAEVVAAAFELARLAARVLDDVEDLDRSDALWRQVGVPQATNAGTALLACAHLALAELATVGVDAGLISELQQDFAQVALTMTAAQHVDLMAWEALGTVGSGRLAEACPLDSWWEIATGKSGSFFALGCRIGARLAVSPSAAQPYSNFGYHLGLLLQVLNDSRGLLGQDGVRDLGRRLTLPVAYTLAVCPEVQQPLLQALDAGDAAQALAIMGRVGAVHYLMAVAESQRLEAGAALEQAGGDPAVHRALLDLLPQGRIGEAGERCGEGRE